MNPSSNLEGRGIVYQNVLLHNVAETPERSNAPGLRLSRVSAQTRSALNSGAAERAFTTAACELRFLHDAPVTATLARILTEWDAGAGLLEVWHGQFQAAASPVVLIGGRQSLTVAPPSNLATLAVIAQRDGHAFDPRVTRLILPSDAETHLLEITGITQPPTPTLLPAVTHLAYGSSITAGACAALPSQGYAARVAAGLGANLINLGFPSTAQLEPALAVEIAGRDWQSATLELGINVLAQWDAKLFKERVQRFLEIIATDLTERRVIVTDLFTTFADLGGDEKTQSFRRIVREAVADLEQPSVKYLSGLSLLGAQHLTTDGVHPTASGHAQIAAGLIRAFAEWR